MLCGSSTHICSVTARANWEILSEADEATATHPACSCMAMLALMVSITIYKQPGSFWEYRMFDLIYPARFDPGS